MTWADETRSPNISLVPAFTISHITRKAFPNIWKMSLSGYWPGLLGHTQRNLDTFHQAQPQPLPGKKEQAWDEGK